MQDPMTREQAIEAGYQTEYEEPIGLKQKIAQGLFELTGLSAMGFLLLGCSMAVFNNTDIPDMIPIAVLALVTASITGLSCLAGIKSHDYYMKCCSQSLQVLLVIIAYICLAPHDGTEFAFASVIAMMLFLLGPHDSLINTEENLTRIPKFGLVLLVYIIVYPRFASSRIVTVIAEYEHTNSLLITLGLAGTFCYALLRAIKWDKHRQNS